MIKRTQVATNMCKDKDFESQNSEITITPDVPVHDSFGEINYLGYVDPITLLPTDQGTVGIAKPKKLVAGPNEIKFNTNIVQDKELGILLIYTAFSKVDSKEKLGAWSFCTANKYSSVIEFKLHNDLKNRQSVKYHFRRRNADKSDIYIKEQVELKYDQSFEYKTLTSLLPGDKLEFYIDTPYE